jgi:hypothetical protein
MMAWLDLRIIMERLGEMNIAATQGLFRAKLWWAVKVPLLVACLFLGLKSIESFLVYSFQAGGLSGLSGYRDRYDLAKTGQLVTLAVFLASQVLGGTLLRTVVASGSAGWGERIKSVLTFSLGFALVTGLAVMIVVFVRR